MAGKKPETTKEQPTAASARPATRPRRAYLSQSDVPGLSLDDALRVPAAIANEYGGHPIPPIDLAVALKVAPGGSQLRALTGASLAYGLTEGGGQAERISLTALGKDAVRPLEDGADLRAKREAFQRPRVVGEFLRRYEGSPLPSRTVGMNVLESLGVPGDASAKTLDLITDGAKSLGLLVTIKDKHYVRLEGGQPVSSVARPGSELGGTATEDEPESEPLTPLERPTVPVSTDRPKPIFIGHGKKKAPLQKLEAILNSFKIPFKTAIAEPNLGRPIPKKVKDVMAECGSAILIFTCDEEFRDADGDAIWRPSENVVHELGAASYAYEDRVVIFKEEGLHFPANYQSIGHIDFVEDAIESKTTELLKELIGFGLVRITPV